MGLVTKVLIIQGNFKQFLEPVVRAGTNRRRIVPKSISIVLIKAFPARVKATNPVLGLNVTANSWLVTDRPQNAYAK